MDKIFINRLLVRGIIGVNADERETPQDVLISLELFIDLQKAGQADDLDNSINYRHIVKKVMAHAEAAGRYTVEALAEDIAQICLRYPAAERVIVRIEKPSAARFVESIGIEIDRGARN